MTEKVTIELDRELAEKTLAFLQSIEANFLLSLKDTLWGMTDKEIKDVIGVLSYEVDDKQ